jgi:hypothetical protein
LIFIIHSLGQAAIFYVGRNITQIEKEIAKD